MLLPIGNILRELTDKPPTKTLYHYTSNDALMKIVASRKIWASEIRYLNDAGELSYFITATVEAMRRKAAMHPEDTTLQEIVQQYAAWQKQRAQDSTMVFVASFTENGDLLSQWRGYGTLGNNVSIGFAAKSLYHSAIGQSFVLGKCIYDPDRVRALADSVAEFLLIAAQNFTPTSSHASRYDGFFYCYEADLWRIASLIKSKAFVEEDEWRLVSDGVVGYTAPSVKFRPGNTMLIPYMELPMTQDEIDATLIDRVIVGPTPHTKLASGALSKFLSQSGLCNTVATSGIAYRG